MASGGLTNEADTFHPRARCSRVTHEVMIPVRHGAITTPIHPPAMIPDQVIAVVLISVAAVQIPAGSAIQQLIQPNSQ